MCLLNLNLFQLKIGSKNTQLALAYLKSMIDSKAKPGDTILLPEVWNSGFNRKLLAQHAEEINTLVDGLKKIAITSDINIAGTVAAPSDKDITLLENSFLYISRDGKALSNYRKIHLFTPNKEDDYFIHGSSPKVLDLGKIRIGFCICYDIRFPELFRFYRRKNVNVILVAACFPKPRLHHWTTLLQARAIENQLFIVATNAVGNEIIDNEKISYFGNSLVVNPSGNIICKLNEEEMTQSVEIDISEVKRSRKLINYLNDAKHEYFFDQP